MSSHNQTTGETSPLLPDSRSASRSSRSGREGERSRFSLETLLIPVVFAIKLGSAMPSTTVAELLRQTVCRLSYRPHGFPFTFVHQSPPQFCDAPQVMQDFAMVSAIIGVLGGITSLVGCGILSRILPYHGRKPVFLFILAMQVTWSCLLLSSQFIPSGLSDWVFCVGMLFYTFSEQFPVGYLINMCIVDISLPENRTAMMSKFNGWGILGISIPLTLGGTITTETGDPLIVFYIAAAIFILTFIYVVFVLPETFPAERRNALRRDIPKASRSETSLSIFDSLKLFVPTRTPGGTRNWRLTWCASHNLMFATAHDYIWSAWFVVASSKYHLTPTNNGIFWSCVTFTGMVTLMMIVPLVVHFLCPYYIRRSARRTLTNEGVNTELSRPETSDHLDVHLAFVSCILVAFSPLLAIMSKTNLALLICAIFTGVAFMHTPTMHSLVSKSVGQHKQGRALAGIHMVDSIGSILSSIVMGSIFAATVDTVPLLLFYVHMAVIFVSTAPLLLIRDADGSRQSN